MEMNQSICILLITLVLSFRSHNAMAEWKSLSTKESQKLLELDTIRSRKIINNYVAYIRSSLNSQSIEVKTEINCSRKMHKLLFQRVTDSRGKVIRESKEHKPWEIIAPDSIYDAVMLYFCPQTH